MAGRIDIVTRTRASEQSSGGSLDGIGMGIGLEGGVFLVGPMWLMVLQNELYTTLISTTGFVFGFGLVLSLVPTFVDGAKVGLDTVMSATAAYAAVLVVFVGTTTPPTTSSS